MRQPFVRMLSTLLLSSLAAAGCGDDSEGTALVGADCPNGGTPTVLTLRDVTPAAGETVENDDIVHAFTIVRPHGQFQDITFTIGPTHTAGNPVSADLQISVTQEGQDARYKVSPITWSTAPARVKMNIDDLYLDQNGCLFGFPKPLFSYDLTPDGEGGGGGAGGDGGAGGGAGGDGGAGGGG